MNPRHAAAPGGQPGADAIADDDTSMVNDGGDIPADTQLLGCLVRCRTAEQVNAITYAVPAEAFTAPVDTAIWRAAEILADEGVSDPASIARTVMVYELWPKDLHHEVSVRLVDAIVQGRFEAHEWQTPAVDVLTAYARRATARHLALLATSLSSARPQNIARDLFAAAEFAETVVHWIGHVDRPQVRAA